MEKGIEGVKIVPPLPGSCRICAARHDPEKPHDKDSLYYQNWFFRRYKRFPTWEDAMSHCDDRTKADFKAMLTRHGISLDDAAVK